MLQEKRTSETIRPCRYRSCPHFQALAPLQPTDPFLGTLSDSLSGQSCSAANKLHQVGLIASHEALDQCGLTVSGLRQDDADHLVTYASRFWKSRLKVLRDAFEAILVRGKIAEGDAVRPCASGKRKLQVVRAEGVVLNGGVDDFLEELWLAKEVLGDPEPESKWLMVSTLEPRLAVLGNDKCYSQE